MEENHYKIFKALSDTTWDYYYTYSWLEGETGLSRDVLKKEIAELREQGTIEYKKGLMNEDGEVAGSGFQIPYSRRYQVESWLWQEYLEKQNKKHGRQKTPLEHFTEWISEVPEWDKVKVNLDDKSITFTRQYGD